MSYKGTDIEDKSSLASPRELTALRATTAELLQAVTVRHKERAAALVDDVENAWRRCNTLQLRLSAQGGHGDVLVALAEALNDAQRARAGALSLTGSLGSTRA